MIGFDMAPAERERLAVVRAAKLERDRERRGGASARPSITPAERDAAILAALAATRRPGDVVSHREAAEAAWMGHSAASASIARLKAAGRWPYVDAPRGGVRRAER